MKILRAVEMGMCFGVKDALQITESIIHPENVTIHGELVHNPEVISQLDRRGFRQAEEANRHSVPETSLVLITAHGISDAERRWLESSDKRLIDTTCPLVRRVHEAALELQSEGRHVLVLGKRGHVEVRGIVEDLQSYDAIGSAEEVEEYKHRRLGIVCQTTLPPDAADAICAEIRLQNPSADIRFIDTICQPTRLRQQAMLELLQQVDAVVVVGGRNSNNTRQLVRLCRDHHTPALHVERAEDLEPEWFAGVKTVGLTAGTSTLDGTIDEVHEALTRIGSDLQKGTSDANQMDTAGNADRART